MNALKEKLPATHEEWLEARKKGIGGSDAGAIIGMNRYKSAYALWCEKSGLIDENTKDSEAMWFGREAEELVARRFTEETGKKVKRSSFTFLHPDYNFMRANVDRLVIGESAGLECKTANVFADSEYQEGYIPPSYYAQCYHYMAVTGLDRWYLAVLIPGRSFHTYCIERDEEQINALIEAEKSFWQMVQDGTEPPAGSTDAEVLTARYPEGRADPIELEVDEQIQRLEEIKQLSKDLKAEQEELENRIKQKMKDAEFGTTKAGYSVSWKTCTTSRLDTKSLKTACPELYQQYLKTSESRRFSIKKPKAAKED